MNICESFVLKFQKGNLIFLIKINCLLFLNKGKLMNIEKHMITQDQFQDIVKNRENLLQVLEFEGFFKRLSFTTSQHDYKRIFERFSCWK